MPDIKSSMLSVMGNADEGSTSVRGPVTLVTMHPEPKSHGQMPFAKQLGSSSTSVKVRPYLSPSRTIASKLSVQALP